MVIYQQTASAFMASPAPPTKPVETPLLASYAYVMLLAARKSIFYGYVATPVMLVAKTTVIYQDMT